MLAALTLLFTYVVTNVMVAVAEAAFFENFTSAAAVQQQAASQDGEEEDGEEEEGHGHGHHDDSAGDKDHGSCGHNHEGSSGDSSSEGDAAPSSSLSQRVAAAVDALLLSTEAERPWR
jgi:ABC-type Zn2+ transport system substrate-binding protein/surface adhesin